MFAYPTPTPALTLPHRAPRAVARPSPPAAPPALRFTVDGSTELEAHLARTCERIAAGIRGLIPRSRLEAVLLGGGYGRGEGGVLPSGQGDRPYNDLEFYVCLRGNRHLNERRFGRALHVLGEILTPQAGVEVEFKLTSLAALARAPVSMFSYDLVHGHRWLVGDEKLLAGCAPHRAAAAIPLAEGTRLLMNRGTGLLLALERLRRAEFTATDADFVARNIAKAKLALGDAVLVAHAQYHWSVRERQRRLDHLVRAGPIAWLPDVGVHHARGVEFKLYPRRSTATRAELLADHAVVSALAERVWLWFESRRLGRAFVSAPDYAHSAAHPAGRPALRNALVNVKVSGPRALLDRRALCHPRERILRTLPLLLWEPAALTTPAQLHFIQHELGTNAADFAALVRAYRARWEHVN